MWLPFHRRGDDRFGISDSIGPVTGVGTRACSPLALTRRPMGVGVRAGFRLDGGSTSIGVGGTREPWGPAGRRGRGVKSFA